MPAFNKHPKCAKSHYRHLIRSGTPPPTSRIPHFIKSKTPSSVSQTFRLCTIIKENGMAATNGTGVHGSLPLRRFLLHSWRGYFQTSECRLLLCVLLKCGWVHACKLTGWGVLSTTLCTQPIDVNAGFPSQHCPPCHQVLSFLKRTGPRGQFCLYEELADAGSHF